MFKFIPLACCHRRTSKSITKASKGLWLVICISSSLYWGSNVISKGILFAKDTAPQAQITELLFKAVKNGDINAVRTAIKAGAELSRVNLNGETAMDIAISNNNFEIANYLVFARRIEQQVTRKLNPVINSVQQMSPEAAPVVEIMSNNHSTSHKPKTKNGILPNKTKPTTIKKLTIKQIKISKKGLSNRNKDNTKTSKTKSNIPAPKLAPTESNIQEDKVKSFYNNEIKRELVSTEPVFFIDKNGNLIKSSMIKIQQIQGILRQRAAGSVPDIEPRRSLFIPKPRLKPNLVTPLGLRPTLAHRDQKSKLLVKPNPINKKIKESELLRNGLPNIVEPPKQKKVKNKTSIVKTISNTSLKKKVSNKQLSDVKKLSKPLKTVDKTPDIDYIRPNRRISPELLNKLRQGLEKGKRLQKSGNGQADKSSKGEGKPNEINSLRKKEQNTKVSSPTLKTPINQASSITPALQSGDNDRTERSIFSRLYNNLTNLLGVKHNSQEAEHKKKPLTDEGKAKSLSQRFQFSEENTVKKQAKVFPSIKQSATQFSIPLNSDNYEIADLKSKRIKINKVDNNNWQNNAIVKTRKINEKQLINDPTTQQSPNASKKPEPEANANKEAKRKESYSVEKAISNVPIRQPTNSMPLTRLRKPLKNILLTLGKSATTDQFRLPHDIAEPNPCIQKRRGQISFCIVPIDWADKIEDAFIINTSLYQGTRAIARYDRGKASHFHALYKSEAHTRIVSYLTQLYGPPTENWKRIIAPFGKPRQPNPTFVWRSHKVKSNKVTILEIRKFDDTRNVFPDTKHGAIRLYTAGGPPVFPIVTAHDIMSIDWAARSDHSDNGLPALARTLRARP